MLGHNLLDLRAGEEPREADDDLFRFEAGALRAESFFSFFLVPVRELRLTDFRPDLDLDLDRDLDLDLDFFRLRPEPDLDFDLEALRAPALRDLPGDFDVFRVGLDLLRLEDGDVDFPRRRFFAREEEDREGDRFCGGRARDRVRDRCRERDRALGVAASATTRAELSAGF